MSIIPHPRLYFCGLNGRLVAKNPQKTIPYDVPIKYAQYLCYVSLWFGEVLGISTQEFKTQYCTQSGRNWGASTANNADIDLELWGQHGDWASFKSPQKTIYEERCQGSSFRFFGGYECPFYYTPCRRQRHYIGCSLGLGWLAINSLRWFHPLNGWDSGYNFSLAQLGLHKGLFSIFPTPVLHPKPTILFTL